MKPWDKRKVNEARVLEYVKANPNRPLSTKEVSEALGINHNSIRNYFGNLNRKLSEVKTAKLQVTPKCKKSYCLIYRGEL